MALSGRPTSRARELQHQRKEEAAIAANKRRWSKLNKDLEQVLSLLARSLQAQQETVEILNDLSGKLAGSKGPRLE